MGCFRIEKEITNMQDLLKEFGFPVTMALTFAGVMIWIAKLLITHFLMSVKEASDERKEITAKFTTIIENHIQHNTQTLQNICDQMKDMSREHKEFMVEIKRMGGR
ncbi:MAG: hypothetical protein NC820_07030 [Candidatus Omnitrophica bacterium]|nr:hypothetical protein [Candidatus Omnitrophota bacterium]